MLGGYAVWTLTEYWLHRVVFHFEPEDGIGARLHWMIHGVHHDHPNDPMRLVMPPSASSRSRSAFGGAVLARARAAQVAAVHAGFLAGYLAYDMIHYHVHHHMPRTAVGRRLRELHMRHHFQDDERGFGVSAPYWDHVFGTAPAEARPLSPVRVARHAGARVTESDRETPEAEVVDGCPSPLRPRPSRAVPRRRRCRPSRPRRWPRPASWRAPPRSPSCTGGARAARRGGARRATLGEIVALQLVPGRRAPDPARLSRSLRASPLASRRAAR